MAPSCSPAHSSAACCAPACAGHSHRQPSRAPTSRCSPSSPAASRASAAARLTHATRQRKRLLPAMCLRRRPPGGCCRPDESVLCPDTAAASDCQNMMIRCGPFSFVARPPTFPAKQLRIPYQIHQQRCKRALRAENKYFFATPPQPNITSPPATWQMHSLKVFSSAFHYSFTS